MILGSADKVRVHTAELQVIDLATERAYWQQRAERAEAGQAHNAALVGQEVAQNERLTHWARGIAHEAGEQVKHAAADRDAAFRVLLDLADAIRELHTEATGAPVCRHCGHAYPCPTLAVLPSQP